MRIKFIAGLSIATVLAGAIATADGHITDKQREAAVEARQSHMQLYAFNLGILGAMAKQEAPYDAGVAATIANDIATLASVSQSAYWLPGTDSDSMENSRSLPAIWEEGSNIGGEAGAFSEAATALQSNAGNGLEALQASMRTIGGTCGSCHRSYRKSNN